MVIAWAGSPLGLLRNRFLAALRHPGEITVLKNDLGCGIPIVGVTDFRIWIEGREVRSKPLASFELKKQWMSDDRRRQPFSNPVTMLLRLIVSDNVIPTMRKERTLGESRGLLQWRMNIGLLLT